MFRRAIGSLLTRRFSPRMALARSLRSLRDFPIGGAAGVATAAFAAGGTLTIHYFNKGTDVDESDTGNKPNKISEEDMKARFEVWMKMHNKTYRDEEEKAMRFQRFKTIFNSYPYTPETLDCFGDWTEEEFRRLHSHSDEKAFYEELARDAMDLKDKYEKGEFPMMRPDVKPRDTQATRISA